jgi:Putative peptidoglycan binding domain
MAQAEATGRMRRYSKALKRVVMLGVLAGCTAPGLTGRLDPMPTPGAAGAENLCVARDLTPALIQTVTENVLVSPAKIAPDGSTSREAVFEKRTRQKIVQERRMAEFAALCPTELTPEFVASLQRALKARGYYTGPVTGNLDDTTAKAVRRYQAQSGLNSTILSAAAARRLGLLVAPR